MTWLKQYTSTNPVQAWATDSGASILAAMDEFILTWLPSRGWTTAAQATQPNASDAHYRWWIDKDIKQIDNSYYAHRAVVFVPNSSTRRLSYATWPAGVAADSIYAGYQLSNTSFGNEFYGTWEFWTSDQDTDSFVVIANGVETGVVALMPPSGSIIPGTPDNSGNYPTSNGPMIPTSGGNDNCWVSVDGGGTTKLRSSIANTAYESKAASGQVKVNFAAISRGTAGSFGTAFLTSTNDCEMITNVRQSDDSFAGVNTTLIDGSYYISIGTGSKLLLKTGAVDPQY